MLDVDSQDRLLATKRTLVVVRKHSGMAAAKALSKRLLAFLEVVLDTTCRRGAALFAFILIALILL